MDYKKEAINTKSLHPLTGCHLDYWPKYCQTEKKPNQTRKEREKHYGRQKIHARE